MHLPNTPLCISFTLYLYYKGICRISQDCTHGFCGIKLVSIIDAALAFTAMTMYNGSKWLLFAGCGPRVCSFFVKLLANNLHRFNISKAFSVCFLRKQSIIDAILCIKKEGLHRWYHHLEVTLSSLSLVANL